MIWILIILLIVADQATKAMISASPEQFGNLEVIHDFFYITYVKNTGAAWSMLAGQRVFLSLLAAAAILVMIFYLNKMLRDNNKLSAFALALMIAGAAGNLIDRLMLGYVRDFLNFYIFGYDFPVFNVADICLTVGVFLLIISTIFEKDPDADAVEPDVIQPKKDRTGV
ncbi:MAG: signal peptidase II [Solobacterium sp.]|nr:signal peptidase II [Solobacterium sp.]MBR3392478.1 signal peptidase II [Bacillota bacterium]